MLNSNDYLKVNEMNVEQLNKLIVQINTLIEKFRSFNPQEIFCLSMHPTVSNLLIDNNIDSLRNYRDMLKQLIYEKELPDKFEVDKEVYFVLDNKLRYGIVKGIIISNSETKPEIRYVDNEELKIVFKNKSECKRTYDDIIKLITDHLADDYINL